MLTIKKYLAVLMFMTTGFALAQTTYYVDGVNGDDVNNSGASGSPFKTIGKAMSSCASGDNIEVEGGSYAESVDVTENVTIKGVTSGLSIDKLRLNNGKTLTISSTSQNITITDSLILQYGLVDVTSYTVLHTAASAGVTGGNDSSFIINGYTIHHVGNTSKTYTWHIGHTTGDYRPVTLNSFSTSKTTDQYFYARCINGGPAFSVALPSNTKNISSVNHWEVGAQETSAVTSAYSLTFDYDTTTNDDGVWDATNLQLLNSDGATAWVLKTQGGTTSRMGSISASATNTIGYFVLGNKKGGASFLGGANNLGSADPFVSFEFNSAGLCEGDTIFFTNLTTNRAGATFLWTFGDEAETNPKYKGVTYPNATSEHPYHIYNKAGNYTVSLQVQNATNNPDVGNMAFSIGILPRLPGYKSVEVYRYPNNGLDTFDDLTICDGEKFWAVDNYDATFQWNPNNDVVSKSVYVIQGLTPEPTKTVLNPIPSNDTFFNTINGPGNYKVVVTRTTNKGCVAEETQDLVIYARPAPAIDALDKCETPPNTTLFVTNSTTDPSPTNTMKQWSWEYEGTFVLNEKVNKSHIFQNAHKGINQVKLIVETSVGCIDSIVKDIEIFPLPKIDMDLDYFCEGETLSADASSSSITGSSNIDMYIWNFDFGKPNPTYDSNAVTNYQYPGPGLYRVQLRLVSDKMCLSDSVQQIRIHPKPTPDFDVNEVCFGDSTELRRLIQTYPNDDSMTYYWYLDYQFIKDDTAFNYLLPNPGSYQLKMEGISDAGCTDSIIKTIRSFYVPNPSFMLDTLVSGNDSIQCFNGNNFVFDFNLGMDPYDTLDISKWVWGDTTIESPIVGNNHSYTEVDTFDIMLFVQNVNGCADSATLTVITVPSPTAGFDWNGLCVPDTVRFFDTSSVSINPIIGRFWDFGNGEADTNVTITQSYYSNAGPHSVKYTIESDNGCRDSITKSIDTLIDRPIANWQLVTGSMPLCKGDSATFMISGGDSVVWLVDLDTNRSKAFSVTGVYKFEVINGGRCKSTDSVQVFAYTAADIKAYSDTVIYRGRRAEFRLVKAASNVKWTPSEYLEDSTSMVVTTKRLVDSMRFYVTALDSNGCEDMDSVTVLIIDPPLVKIPNIITPNGDGENQTWNLIDIPDLFLYDIIISDRQGRRVYESKDYQNDWSAKDMNGIELPNGVYFYYMNNRQTNETYRGYIQVIR